MELNGYEDGNSRAQPGSILSASNYDADLEGAEVEQILNTNDDLACLKSEYYARSNCNFPECHTRSNDNQTASPVTSPSYMTSPNGNLSDTEEGGMESDDVDSTNELHRKRNESVRYSRASGEVQKKRPRKQRIRAPNVRLGSGYHSSSQLSSPNGDVNETVPIQQNHLTSTDQLFAFSGPTKLHDNSAGAQPNRPRLTILVQPGEHHRARYESEGSRGAVKDYTGESSPKIKLEGYSGTSPIPVHVFVSNEKGNIKPHVFFKTCKIASRNSTACDDDEVYLDGQRTDAIKINLCPKDDFVAVIDCVGILKLRNADVENESKSKAEPKPKRRNPTVRLAFYAVIPGDMDGNDAIELLAASNQISCSQPEGQPEILRISSLSGSPEGGDEIFIIGKNFNKNCQIIFKKDKWEGLAEINSGFFHKEHLVILTPRYYDTDILIDVAVKVHILYQDKLYDPYDRLFVYEGRTQNEAPEINEPMRLLKLKKREASRKSTSLTENERPTPYSRQVPRDVPTFEPESMVEQVPPSIMKTEIEESSREDMVKPIPQRREPDGFDMNYQPSIENSQPLYLTGIEFKRNPNQYVGNGSTPPKPQMNSPEQLNEQKPALAVENGAITKMIENSDYGEPSTKRIYTVVNSEHHQQQVFEVATQSNSSYKRDYAEESVTVEDEKPLNSGFIPEETGFTIPVQRTDVFEQMDEPVKQEQKPYVSQTYTNSSMQSSRTVAVSPQCLSQQLVEYTQEQQNQQIQHQIQTPEEPFTNDVTCTFSQNSLPTTPPVLILNSSRPNTKDIVVQQPINQGQIIASCQKTQMHQQVIMNPERAQVHVVSSHGTTLMSSQTDSTIQKQEKQNLQYQQPAQQIWEEKAPEQPSYFASPPNQTATTNFGVPNTNYSQNHSNIPSQHVLHESVQDQQIRCQQHHLPQTGSHVSPAQTIHTSQQSLLVQDSMNHSGNHEQHELRLNSLQTSNISPPTGYVTISENENNSTTSDSLAMRDNSQTDAKVIIENLSPHSVKQSAFASELETPLTDLNELRAIPPLDPNEKSNDASFSASQQHPSHFNTVHSSQNDSYKHPPSNLPITLRQPAFEPFEAQDTMWETQWNQHEMDQQQPYKPIMDTDIIMKPTMGTESDKRHLGNDSAAPITRKLTKEEINELMRKDPELTLVSLPPGYTTVDTTNSQYNSQQVPRNQQPPF